MGGSYIIKLHLLSWLAEWDFQDFWISKQAAGDLGTQPAKAILCHPVKRNWKILGIYSLQRKRKHWYTSCSWEIIISIVSVRGLKSLQCWHQYLSKHKATFSCQSKLTIYLVCNTNCARLYRPKSMAFLSWEDFPAITYKSKRGVKTIFFFKKIAHFSILCNLSTVNLTSWSLWMRYHWTFV